MTYFNCSLEKLLCGGLLVIGAIMLCRKGNLRHRMVRMCTTAMKHLPNIRQISSLFHQFTHLFSSSNPPPKNTLNARIASHPAGTIQAKQIPRPSSRPNHAETQSYQQRLLSQLDQRKQFRTYARPPLRPLFPQEQNRPIPLASVPVPENMNNYARHATYFSYNAEGTHDHSWGCAWRTIQTILSAYNIHTSFEDLFHLFGPLENLKCIYQDKYARELPCSRPFAAYDLQSGWTEPFIGEMASIFIISQQH